MKYSFTKEQQEEILKQYHDLDLKWYQSTRGPQISASVKFLIIGLVLNMAKIFFGITIGPEWVNLVIDAALVVFMGGGMLWGYVKGKRELLRNAASERAVLGGTLAGRSPSKQPGAQFPPDDLDRLSKDEPSIP